MMNEFIYLPVWLVLLTVGLLGGGMLVVLWWQSRRRSHLKRKKVRTRATLIEQLQEKEGELRLVNEELEITKEALGLMKNELLLTRRELKSTEDKMLDYRECLEDSRNETRCLEQVAGGIDYDN